MSGIRSATFFAPLLLGAACAPSIESGPPGQSRTSAAIEIDDLRLRLQAFAHDTMLGRQAGTFGNFRGTEYLAREARRIGLLPAGENGTYFQTVPLQLASGDPDTRLGSATLAAGDLIPLVPPYFPFAPTFDVTDASVVFGGWGEIGEAEARGKVVIMAASNPQQPPLGEWAARYADAELLVIVVPQIPPTLKSLLEGDNVMLLSDEHAAPPAVLVGPDAAERLYGSQPVGSVVGKLGAGSVSGRGGLVTRPVEAPARNVIALIPGSDPSLRDEYVVIGAHNDHVGVTPSVLDHDSVRAHNLVVRPEGAQSPARPLSAEELPRFREVYAQLRSDGARPDSINNGADDDGTGSVALLEIAEQFIARPPKRSLLFVWHTAEELGMVGSGYFTDHPTRPLSAMVAQLNVDMIGRGMEPDLPGGGIQYLQLIGSRRLSTELGDIVERVNSAGHGFVFDYQYDAEGHPQNIYCRSDHASYARFGIPVTFFTTGVHPEYHQITDEIEYISFPKLHAVTAFIADVAGTVADLDHRVAVDQPLPDPDAPCTQ